MRDLEYEFSKDLRDIDRSQFRNMSSDCAYCGYRTRPSCSKDSCCSSCHINYNTSKNYKK